MAPVAVDHETRRTALSRVLVRLVADEGIEAVTVRTVAARAGVSIGAVQHYFRTKDAMLMHAHAMVNDAVSARVEAAVAELADPREVLRAVILAVLPVDAETTRVIRVFNAFEAQAMYSPVLAERARRDADELHREVEALLAAAGARHPRLDAVTTVALMAGLCQRMLPGDARFSVVDAGFDLVDAVAIVDLHLDRVLPGRGPRR